MANRGLKGAIDAKKRELVETKRERARLVRNKPRGWRNAAARHDIFARTLEEDIAYMQREAIWAETRKAEHALWLKANPQHAPRPRRAG